MRKEFNYFMPTKIVFGNGYIDKVEEYIKKYGINKLSDYRFIFGRNIIWTETH